MYSLPNHIPDAMTGAIEGADVTEGIGDGFPEIYADKDCRCYCQTCNKYVELKKGDRVPPRCGKLMEVLD